MFAWQRRSCWRASRGQALRGRGRLQERAANRRNHRGVQKCSDAEPHIAYPETWLRPDREQGCCPRREMVDHQPRFKCHHRSIQNESCNGFSRSVASADAWRLHNNRASSSTTWSRRTARPSWAIRTAGTDRTARRHRANGATRKHRTARRHRADGASRKHRRAGGHWRTRKHRGAGTAGTIGALSRRPASLHEPEYGSSALRRELSS
jgi:hypothetical protein